MDILVLESVSAARDYRRELLPRDLAELKGPVKDRLRTYGLYDRLGDDRIPPTLGTAIDEYLERTGVHWVDWDDRPPEGAAT